MRTYGCTTVRAAHPTERMLRRWSGSGTGLLLVLREWVLGAFTALRREK